MSVTVKSQDFLKLISLAKITAYPKPQDDPKSAAAWITCHNLGAAGYVLVASTSDGVVAGQTSIEAEGTFDKPFLLSLGPETAWVSKMVKTSMAKMKKLEGSNAEFTVELSVAPGASGQGQALTVRTLTDGLPGAEDTEATIPLVDDDGFSTETMEAFLAGRITTSTLTAVDGSPLIEGRAEVFSPEALKVMSAVGAQIGDPVFSYPGGHKAGRRTVVCGDSWRGSVPGTQHENPGPQSPVDLDEPFVELYPVSREKDPACGDGATDKVVDFSVDAAPAKSPV